MAKDKTKNGDSGEPEVRTVKPPAVEVPGVVESVTGEPRPGVQASGETADGDVLPPVKLAPHLEDRIARPHTVHLGAHKSPGRKVFMLRVDGDAFTFRRGGDKPQLEHVINLTPPAARQLRAEGWHVTVKE